METKTYDLQIEPSGVSYRNLIDFAVSSCPLVLLVVRHEVELKEAGQWLLSSLQSFLESQVSSSYWPGTELLVDEANIFYFRLEIDSARLLKVATDHLYGWRQPNLPEDLCILREDREPWLVTISHEDDGFFSLTDWERKDLLRAVPTLKIMPLES
jgi:hypothetical protein